MPRRDLASYSTKVGYKKHPGMVAWLFHRISGVLIGLYLLLHMLGISGLSTTVGNFTRIRAVVAVMAVLFVLHALNGIRIILMEFAQSAERKKFMPHLVITTVIIIAIGAFFVFKLAAQS